MRGLQGILMAAAFVLVADAAAAQVPNVQVYFNLRHDTVGPCRVTGLDSLYVIMNNWNMYVQAVDFSIDYPTHVMTFLADQIPQANAVTIGSSDSYDYTNGAGSGYGGIAIGFNLPENGYQEIIVDVPQIFWTGTCDCGIDGQYPINVRGYQYNEPTAGKQNPTAIRWPDYVQVEGVGMKSWVCFPPLTTEQSTWGAVKALYRK